MCAHTQTSTETSQSLYDPIYQSLIDDDDSLELGERNHLKVQ